MSASAAPGQPAASSRTAANADDSATHAKDSIDPDEIHYRELFPCSGSPQVSGRCAGRSLAAEALLRGQIGSNGEGLSAETVLCGARHQPPRPGPARELQAYRPGN